VAGAERRQVGVPAPWRAGGPGGRGVTAGLVSAPRRTRARTPETSEAPIGAVGFEAGDLHVTPSAAAAPEVEHPSTPTAANRACPRRGDPADGAGWPEARGPPQKTTRSSPGSAGTTAALPGESLITPVRRPRIGRSARERNRPVGPWGNVGEDQGAGPPGEGETLDVPSAGPDHRQCLVGAPALGAPPSWQRRTANPSQSHCDPVTLSRAASRGGPLPFARPGRLVRRTNKPQRNRHTDATGST
jgi:hypothetical protein